MRFIIPALLVYSSAAVFGQQAQDDSLKIGSVTVTGSLRSRVYFWDWFQPTAGNNNYAYSGNLLRIGFSQSRDTWDWNAEFAVPFLLGLARERHRHGTAAGRARPGRELSLGQQRQPEHRDDFSQAALRPIRRPGRDQSAHAADRAIRVQRRQRDHAEERDSRPRSSATA